MTGATAGPGPQARSVRVPTGGPVLAGDLTVPGRALGLVVFAHGSGSSRHSPRNRMVATELQRVGLATLLLDLLSEDEELIDRRSRALRFDVGMLARRLVAAKHWAGRQPATGGLPVGYFGASTGAAAALIAADLDPAGVGAVVSRGGRPDLAGDHLARVAAPTLLIVGGADPVVLDLNREAAARVGAEARLDVVEGATHLFEEPGALETVAELAAGWFTTHLAGAPAAPGPTP